jgi:uncharacterized protein DUF3175
MPAKAPRRRARRTAGTARRSGRRYWSRAVTQRSDALDLESRAFTWRDPKRIASSLKRSAERSRRRKSSPYRSAMSMLTFYINRGGRNLSPARKRILGRAKIELRRAFGRA